MLPLACVGALVLVAASVGLVAGRGPDPNAVPTAQQVDDRTMSPFCVGLTLAACPSNQALELRQKIAEMVAQRMTNRQIDGWLLASYPSSIAGTPRSLAAWAVPGAAVAIGLVVVVVVAMRSGGPDDPGSGPPAPPPVPPDDSARLAADLKRFRDAVTE